MTNKYMSADALLPHDVDAEEALLGSILIDGDVLPQVAEFLDEGDFFVERNGWIFAAIRDLYEARRPSDLVTLSDELERRGKLYELGGPAYITSLINATPTSIHAEFYGRIVERKSILRRLIDAAGKIARMAYEDQNDVDEVINRAEELIIGISNRHIPIKSVTVGEVLDEYDALLDKAVNGETSVEALKVGIPEADKFFNGLKPGNLITLAGRPGQGKTALALDIAKRIAMRGLGVGFVSIEMDAMSLTQRVIANVAGIDSTRLQNALLTDAEHKLTDDEYRRYVTGFQHQDFRLGAKKR